MNNNPEQTNLELTDIPDPSDTPEEENHNMPNKNQATFDKLDISEELFSLQRDMKALSPTLFKRYIIKEDTIQSFQERLDTVVRAESELRKENKALYAQLSEMQDQMTQKDAHYLKLDMEFEQKCASFMQERSALEAENKRLSDLAADLERAQSEWNNQFLSAIKEVLRDSQNSFEQEVSQLVSSLNQAIAACHKLHDSMQNSSEPEPPSVLNEELTEKLELIAEYITKEKAKAEASKGKADAERKQIKKEKADFEAEMQSKQEQLNRQIAEFEAQRDLTLKELEEREKALQSGENAPTQPAEQEDIEKMRERLAFYEELLAGIRQIKGYTDVMTFDRNLSKFQRAYNDMTTIAAYCGRAKDKELASSLKDIIHDIKRTASEYVNS